VLPASTEEVSRVLAYCHQHGIKVVARGAGTSLSGGALPAEDAVVVGISRMNRVLEIDYMNRVARVEVGITNLGISDIVRARDFFYAPDPSSQLACTLAGNIGMNSGGAHCLKYGVTTNNVLGLKMVLMDGEVIEIGGPHLDSPGYDLLGAGDRLRGPARHRHRGDRAHLRAAEGARPMLLGFDSSEAAGQCVAAIIGAGIVPVAIEFMDRPAIHVCEAFAKAGYPLEVEAMLIVEVEGSNEEIADLLAVITDIATPFAPKAMRISQNAEQSAAIWKGRKAAFGAIGRISDYYCMDGVIPLGKLGEVLVAISHICDKHGLRVANIFHAGDGNLHPLVLYDANDQAQAEPGRAGGPRDPRAVRGLRRLPHGRAWRRHREARPHARAVHRDRPGAADAHQDGVRPQVAAESRPRSSRSRAAARRWKQRKESSRCSPTSARSMSENARACWPRRRRRTRRSR
jgi:glycolate oxidase